MSETPQCTQVDTEYATSVRYTGLGSGEKPFARQAIVADRLSTEDGLHAELDHIVTQTAAVAESDALNMLPDEAQDKLRSGHVLAGRKDPKTGKTEMGIMSPEAFHAMIAKAVGHEALEAYGSSLKGKEAEASPDDSDAKNERTEQKQHIVESIADFRMQVMRIAESAHQDPDARDSVDATLVRVVQEAAAHPAPGSTEADQLMLFGAAAGRVRSPDAVHAAMGSFINTANNLIGLMKDEQKLAARQVLNRVEALSSLRFRGPEYTRPMQEESDQVLFDLAQKGVNEAEYPHDLRQLMTASVLLAEGISDSPHATRFVAERLNGLLQLNV